MTISSTTTKISYSGDGSTITFQTTFKFINNDDVEVILRSSSGTETTWTEGTQYELTGAGNSSGGTVTVNTSPTDYTPASGTTLTIRRVPDETQESSFPLGGDFPSVRAEDALDYLTMLVQAHSEKFARTILLAATSSYSNLTLPDPSSEKFLRWKSDLSGLENLDISTLDNEVATTAFGRSLIDDANASAALTTLGFSTFIKTLIDDADAAAARTTLGLGTAATQNLATMAAITMAGLFTGKTGANIASATTVDLTAATGNLIHITGTTTTTAFTMNSGQVMWLIADAAWPLTYHATNLKINGGASYTCAAGDRLKVYYDGTTVYVDILKQDGTPIVTVGNHEVVVHTGNGHGSTNNKIRRFTTALVNTGTSITYADSAANGASFTINNTGMYAIHYSDDNSASSAYFGVSKNSSELTTVINSIAVADRVFLASNGIAALAQPGSRVVRLTAGDVIRPHTGGSVDDSTDKCFFSIRRLADV